MPTKFNIPSRVEHHCEPCEFHKCVGAFYGHDHSWRDYSCTHPNAYESELPLDDPEKEKLRLEIQALTRREGRSIGRTEKCPEWCPLRKQSDD